MVFLATEVNKKELKGLSKSSMVKHMLGMWEALDSVPSTKKEDEG